MPYSVDIPGRPDFFLLGGDREEGLEGEERGETGLDITYERITNLKNRKRINFESS